VSTALILIHGRSQQLAQPLRTDPDRVADHIANLKRTWLAGLAKGLVLAERLPVSAEDTFFPFYGNLMADLIDKDRAAGGRTPDLEIAPRAGSPAATRDQMVFDSARRLGFNPTDALHTNDEIAALTRRRQRDNPADELDWSAALSHPIALSALQFLARKTGTPGWIIEDYLTDVAYYLTSSDIRGQVIDVVQVEIDRARQIHDDVVLISHSLGTVVAYDVLESSDTRRPVSLLLTAGAPLGLPVVQKHLLGSSLDRQPGIPTINTAKQPRWINGYDVRDVVALIHPLGPCFQGGQQAIRDIVTHNPDAPHSIADYLADRDIAAAISSSMS
jgi:hypothetical protein